jgi:hypothetical protein
MHGDGAGCVCGLGYFDEDDFGGFCETMSVYSFKWAVEYECGIPIGYLELNISLSRKV